MPKNTLSRAKAMHNTLRLRCSWLVHEIFRTMDLHGQLESARLDVSGTALAVVDVVLDLVLGRDARFS